MRQLLSILLVAILFFSCTDGQTNKTTKTEFSATEFANKIMNLHSQTQLFGYKMHDKRGGQNNIHSWDIGVNGILTFNRPNVPPVEHWY